MKPFTSIVLPSAASRLSEARALIGAIEPPLVIVAATRATADEFAFSIAEAKGATFGITRASVPELVAKLAVPALARKGLTPSAPLSDEAVSARVTDELLKDHKLAYFAPVAGMPGFPRALSRTLGELRMAALDPSRLTGHEANSDLSALLARAIEERKRAGAVDYATMLATATGELRSNSHALAGKTVLLLDVAIGSKAEAEFIAAVRAAAKSVIATIPSGDRATLEHLHLAPEAPQARQAPQALERLQH